jgi:hypothetical protein
MHRDGHTRDRVPAVRSTRTVVTLCIAIGLALAALAMAPSDATPGQRAAAQENEDSLLVRRERAQWTALQARDTAAVARLMGGGVVDVDVSGAHRTTPGSIARFVQNCQTSDVALDGIHVVHRASTAIVAYRATLTQTCWGQRAPSPLYVMTVYERGAGEWIPVAHSETPSQSR